MRNKVLRLNAKDIIKNNRDTVNKIFSITIIFMSILFVILNPIVKSIIDIIMKSIELNDGSYMVYNEILNIMSLGISLMLVTVFSDFILCSLSLDLIRNEPFDKHSIKLRFNSIDKYMISKLISLTIQSVWYIILNLLRVVISIIFMVGALSLFAQISNGGSNFSKGTFYFLLFSTVFLVFLIFIINIIIFSETFVLPFIALDTQNNFKKKDIFKVYMSIMKKNRIKSLKLLLGFVPNILLLLCGVIIFYYIFNAVSHTMILLAFGIITLLILALYPKIMITLALAYERMYNYSEQSK